MASSDTDTPTRAQPTDPVLFAYDGSDLARLAIERAGRQLVPGRDALVVCVWQPGDVGFIPTSERHLKAADAADVRRAAEETASHGASLAAETGFRPQSLAIEAAPTWRGIVEVADERKASLIVLGSHNRKGLGGHLLGSVAAAVATNSTSSVLIVHC